MKFGDLIDTAIDMIKGFNPVTQTVDSHSDEFLDKVRPLLTPRWRTHTRKCF